MTNGIYYLQPIFSGCCNWYWGEDSTGDLYEAEESYKAHKPMRPNRFILMRLPEGEIIEPIQLTEGQYLGMPSLYHEHKVHIVMVDFNAQKIHLLAFDPDGILQGEKVQTLDILPLSHVEDCYNVFLKGSPVSLTRQSNEQYFQIVWSLEDGCMDVGFSLEDRESFSHRDGDKLYFTSWWEEEEPEYEYHEEVIIRNMKGEILERFEGNIQEIRPTEYYVLQ